MAPPLAAVHDGIEVRCGIKAGVVEVEGIIQPTRVKPTRSIVVGASMNSDNKTFAPFSVARERRSQARTRLGLAELLTGIEPSPGVVGG